ncbi:MAG: hypothetical protein ACAH11_11870 [Sphingomonas sp.]
MIAALLLTALMPGESPVTQLDCTVHYQDGAKSAQVGMTFGGPKHVSFVDPGNIFADERGTWPANKRGWLVRQSRDGATIVLRSRTRVTGNSAQIMLEREASGDYAGQFFSNQGMLTEKKVYGFSGTIRCKAVA